MGDDDFERAATEAISAVSPDLWSRIADALRDVAAADRYCVWHRPAPRTQIVDGTERTVHPLGHPVYTAEVERLLDLIRAAGLVVPFDWMSWDGAARYAGGVGLDRAPIADAVRVVTAVIRSERFSDGAIEGALENGVLIAAVRRLVERPAGC